MVTAHSRNFWTNEGLGVPGVHDNANRIEQLKINPGDFDSIDTLRLVELAPPCPPQ